MRPLAAIGAILVMLGFVVRAVSVSDGNRIAQFGAAPERLTVRALIERGPYGPKNVIITDYLLCKTYVIEERIVEHRSGKKDSRWERAFVPIAPAVPGVDGKVDTQPFQVHVVVHCADVKDEKDMFSRCAGPELQGLVEGTVSELDPDAKNLLAEKYPDIRFDKCIVVTEGARVSPVAPPGLTRKASLWVAGFGFVLLGIAAILRSEQRTVKYHS